MDQTGRGIIKACMHVDRCFHDHACFLNSVCKAVKAGSL